MIGRIESFLRRLRRRLSRSEWQIKLLGLSVSEDSANEPGLLLIQIDGLARRQFERALARGRMPFLRKLIRRQHYRLHWHYSGLPSSTPAVQGELFYGVKCAVPAFSFVDKETGKLFRMFDAPATAAMEERLIKKGGESLLKDGSAYSNIYTGGAAEAHFCGPTLDVKGMMRYGPWWALPLVCVLNIPSLFRIIYLVAVEIGLAISDCLRGITSGYEMAKELKFVLGRVSISVLAREVITVGARIDLARGLPVVEVNYLGYDEQAHRRGPSSAFAHWCLKGIDDSIKRLWKSAHRTQRRHYDIYIYSDHGQEDTIPFPKEMGYTVEEAVERAYNNSTHTTRHHGVVESREVQMHRFEGLSWILPRWLRPRKLSPPDESEAGDIIVTAMGPVGNVYLPEQPDEAAMQEFARRLVKEGVPLVMLPTGEKTGVAFTAEGEFKLPDDMDKVFGKDHPFLEPLAEDLVCLINHECHGSLTFSGWRKGAKPFSFPMENGSHAGPGPNETAGFALLPADAPLPGDGKGYLRPIDLRQSALEISGRAPRSTRANGRRPAETSVIRVMTYNVHSCIGMDGRHSPDRIAKVIAQAEPDIVCLQELDVGRLRTRGVDQAHLIAKAIEMDHHFHPVLQLAEEQYGDAILSRFPMTLVRSAALPGLATRPNIEPRGALWVTIEVDGVPLHIINTHLGLWPKERRNQAEALAGKEWLLHPECRGAVVLCGDLNATPSSPVCRTLGGCLRDAQTVVADHKPQKTWFGRVPVGRIDHVFVSTEVEVVRSQVVGGDLARAASDHLPLVIDMKIKR